MTRRVLLVTNIPTPYRIPLFNELAAQLRPEGLSLKVVFGALGYARRKWAMDMQDCDFEYEVLPSSLFRFKGSESVSFTYRGLYSLLRREKPAVTVVTGFSVATVKLWLRNLVRHMPYIIWSGAIESDARPTSWLRRLQRRILIRSAAGFVAYGSRARRYLEGLGAPADRISIAINTVDTAFYGGSTRRRGEGMGGPHVLLCLGDLSIRKRVDLAIRAVWTLSLHRRDFQLRLLGDGSERDKLAALARAFDIADLVQFEGFKQKGEVADALAGSDCLLFPTGFDIWGLVLVEAMASGVPCIASVRAGATADLVEDGVTGFAVDFEDTQAVANRIGWLLDNPEAAQEIGRAALAYIEENVSLRVSAEGIVNAVRRVGAGVR